MTISAMIGEMMRECLNGGSDADLSRAIDQVNAAIDEMVEDGPVFANEAWAEAKRDELKAALCLIEVARWKKDQAS